jgi:hypothetical protein
MLIKIILLPFTLVKRFFFLVFGIIKFILSSFFGVGRFIISRVFGTAFGALIGFFLGSRSVGIRIPWKKRKKKPKTSE